MGAYRYAWWSVSESERGGNAAFRHLSSRFIFLLPLVCLVLCVGVIPAGSALYNAFFHDSYGVRSFVGLGNFRTLFRGGGLAKSLNITVFWALSVTLVSSSLGFLFAVQLVQWRRSAPLYGLLLILWGIPLYIAVPLWRAIIHGSGGNSLLSFLLRFRINLLTDPVSSFFATLLVAAWLMAPLTTFVLVGAISKVPKYAVEAAKLDGASNSQIALSIYLPNVRETLLVMAVLNFLKAFKEFGVIFLLTSGGPPLVSGFSGRHIIGATTTLEVFLYETFQTTGDYGLSAAFSVVIFGLVFIIMLVWYLVKKGKGQLLSIFTAAAQIVLGGSLGWLWAVGYAVGVRWRKAFVTVFFVQLVYTVVQSVRSDLLSAFPPGLLLAAFTLYLYRRTPFRVSPHPIGQGLWQAGRWAVPALLAISTLFLLYMLLWMAFSRLPTSYIDGVIPRFLAVNSFSQIFTEEGVGRFFLNTLVVASITGLVTPLITFPAAAYLSGRAPAATGAFLTSVQIVGFAGGMHSLIPLYELFGRFGLSDSYIPLVLIYGAHTVPFSLFTIKAYLDSLPSSLRDAALAEGMGAIRYLARILVPLCLPVITTTAMVAFLNAWNGFLAPLLFLDSDEKYTISIKMYSLVGGLASGSPKWNLFAAVSLVNLLILGLVFFPLRKTLRRTALLEFEG